MKLALPAAGRLKPNNEHDPLPYYYRPLLGWLYRKRLQMGLDLVLRTPDELRTLVRRLHANP